MRYKASVEVTHEPVKGDEGIYHDSWSFGMSNFPLEEVLEDIRTVLIKSEAEVYGVSIEIEAIFPE